VLDLLIEPTRPVAFTWPGQRGVAGYTEARAISAVVMPSRSPQILNSLSVVSPFQE
jgi:hypothetical protein